MIEKIHGFVATIPEHIALLIVAGAGGAFVRAVYMPEAAWRRRIIEGVAGVMSAVFLGGIVGHVINAWTGGGPMAFLAAGFIMGEGGIAAVRAFRHRILRYEDK